MHQINIKRSRIPAALLLLGQILLPGCQVGLTAGPQPSPTAQPSAAPSATPTAAPSTSTSALPNLELEVSASRVDCVGLMPQKCLQTRRAGTSAWQNWFDPIEGFSYEEGTSYTILVSQENIPDPPQDSSSIRYRLIRILSQTKL